VLLRELSLRFSIGTALVVIGVFLMMYAANNINELLFIQGKTSSPDLPLYSGQVAVPNLLGMLLVIDGLVICGLSRRSSIILHLLSNMIWLFATYQLYLTLQEPVTSRLVFYRIFVLFMLAVVLFTVGALVNFLPRRTSKDQKSR